MELQHFLNNAQSMLIRLMEEILIMKTLNSTLFSNNANLSRIKTMFIIFILVFIYFGFREFLDYRYKLLHNISSAPVVEQDIVIPFELKNGWIILGVTVENRNLEAIYDTGCAANWVSGNPSSPFKSFISTGVSENGWCGLNHPGYFPKLKVANIEFGNIPFYLNYDEKNHFSSFLSGEPLRCILGNDFFRNYVVTIDYPAKCLILRNPKYDIATINISSKVSLMDVSYLCAKGTTIPSAIMLPARILDNNIQFMMDTGNYHEGVLLDPSFVKNKFAGFQKFENSSSYNIFSRRIDFEMNLNFWDIGSLRGKCKYFIMSENKYSNPAYDPVKAIIGSDQLRDCRITIDYKRKKVLIERTADIRNEDFSLKPEIKSFGTSGNGAVDMCDPSINPIPEGYERHYDANGGCVDSPSKK